MKPKTIASLVLILFVGASILTIIGKEAGLTSALGVETASKPEHSQAVEAKDLSKPTSTKVIAYYFHGNARCYTCKKIEELTTEAIRGGFAQEIKDGRVELKVANVEDPGNEHFVQDYQLVSRSVVVARYEGQEQKDWKRLDEVWQLVRKPDAFIAFVREQTLAILKAGDI